jgi:hypothetical protein
MAKYHSWHFCSRRHLVCKESAVRYELMALQGVHVRAFTTDLALTVFASFFCEVRIFWLQLILRHLNRRECMNHPFTEVAKWMCILIMRSDGGRNRLPSLSPRSKPPLPLPFCNIFRVPCAFMRYLRSILSALPQKVILQSENEPCLWRGWSTAAS